MQTNSFIPPAPPPSSSSSVETLTFEYSPSHPLTTSEITDCFLSGDWSAFDRHAAEVRAVIFGNVASLPR